MKLKSVSVISRYEVFFHFMLVEHGADRERDLGGAARWIALAHHGGLDAGKISLGGGKEVFALAGTLRRRDRDCDRPAA